MNPEENVAEVKKQLEGPIALLKSAWDFFMSYWKIIIPMVILPLILSFIGASIQLTGNIFLLVLGMLISLAATVFSIAIVPALINTIQRLTENPSAVISLKEQYKFGFGYFVSLLLVAIIVGFSFLGSFILLVIPGVIFFGYAAFYLFALVIDDKRGFSALTESYRLVKGRWWPVIGRLLFIGLIISIIQSILVALGFAVGAGSGLTVLSLQSSTDSMPVFIISALINLIGTCIITPIAMAYMFRMYTSLKATAQQDVAVGKFKQWTVAFICIGVVSAILAFATIPLVVLNSARTKADAASNMEKLSQQIQAEIQKQIGTSSPVQQ